MMSLPKHLVPVVPDRLALLRLLVACLCLWCVLVGPTVTSAQPTKSMTEPKPNEEGHPQLAPFPDFSERKIALLHMHDRAPFFEQLGSLTLANKARYAARHGYELVYRVPGGTKGVWSFTTCDNSGDVVRPPAYALAAEPEQDKAAREQEKKLCVKRDDTFDIDHRAPTFGKIKLTLAACRTRPGYWALWTDADAMVVNQTIPLEHIIDDRYDIILSVDWLMINAGMILFKCSPWTIDFLQRVYAARQFDQARALDQSAFQHFFDKEADMDKHLKRIPKHWINVYTEEYRPGDFLLHMAGKLYEATTKGATAIAHQYDMLSMVDDIEDVEAFFRGRHLLTSYSGTCDVSKNNSECLQEDDRRMMLDEPLIAMSYPSRYRHVGLRYYWLGDWKDVYDTPDWRDNALLFDPSGFFSPAEKMEEESSDEDDLNKLADPESCKQDEL